MGTRRDFSSSELSDQIKSKAIELGFDLCGITHAGAFDELAKEYNRRKELFDDASWYAEGHYDFMFESLAYPERALKGAKSLIICARRHNKYIRPKEIDGRIGKVYIFDPRTPYAKTYKTPEDFEGYLKELGLNVVAAPLISCRRAAERAGLGRFGKNNFIYTRFGSRVWFDLWVTDVELQYDEPKKQNRSLCPPDCTKCVDACPTKALCAPNTLDYSKCIPYLCFYPSVPPKEKPLCNLPPEDLRKKMGGWLYGCDVCQDVCPMNRKWSDEEEFPGLGEAAPKMTLENIFRMDETYFQTVLYSRFFYLRQDCMWQWKNNSIRAMANSGDPKYIEYIEEACSDPNEYVREMGVWARQRIKDLSSQGEMNDG